ncbi:hypothetical protein C8J56DRAFT_883493 [Mycena floridula]|nr:hypothetical protein C8J56DRAFT_883493 [Mycena floridula]
MGGRKRKANLAGAAAARAARQMQRQAAVPITISDTSDDESPALHEQPREPVNHLLDGDQVEDSDDEIDCTGWTGAMKEYRKRLVEYVVRDVQKELVKDIQVPLRPLVLVAHDEMTAQANDSDSMSWVFQGEQPLKKKAVGRGVHRSDVICSTLGHRPLAGQSLDYGKNYDGYWTGELFVKQTRSFQTLKTAMVQVIKR